MSGVKILQPSKERPVESIIQEVLPVTSPKPLGDLFEEVQEQLDGQSEPYLAPISHALWNMVEKGTVLVDTEKRTAIAPATLGNLAMEAATRMTTTRRKR